MTGNIHWSAEGKTGKKILIEDVEDDVDELPDSYFFRASVRVFGKYIMGRLVSFHCQSLLTLLKYFGGGIIVRI